MQGGQSRWESRRPHLRLIPPRWRCARVLSCSLHCSHCKPPLFFLSLSFSLLSAVMEKNGWMHFSCMTVNLSTCHTLGCVREIRGSGRLDNAGLELRDVIIASGSGSPFHLFPPWRNVHSLQVNEGHYSAIFTVLKNFFFFHSLIITDLRLMLLFIKIRLWPFLNSCPTL